MKDVPIKDETELGLVADAFFHAQGWRNYPEVVIPLFNGRPDIIGVKNTLVQAIECKLSLTFPVIEQLARWQLDASLRRELQKAGRDCPIAIPHLLVAFVGRGARAPSPLKQAILDEYRIGIYTVSKRPCHRYYGSKKKPETPYFSSACDNYWIMFIPDTDAEYEIRLELPPKIQHGSRKTAHRIIAELNSDMVCAKAGATSSRAGYMTPFKRTMNRVKQLLSDGKERHISQIVQELGALGGHHYSTDRSAESSIAKFIEKFEIAKRSRDVGIWFKNDQIK